MSFAATIFTEDETVGPVTFMSRVMRAAAGFRDLGVSRGDCIAILLRNESAFLEASAAAQQLGAYAVPLNWHFKSEELLYVIADSVPKVLVAHDDLLKNISSSLPDGLAVILVPTPPSLRRAFPTGSVPPIGEYPCWHDWIEAQTPLADASPLPTDSVIYTSGTTGRPKGVRRQPPTAEQAAMGERMRSAVFDIGPGDRVLVSAPLYHTAPNNFSLRAVRLAEALVLLPRFEPERFLAAIERYRITHVYAVPTMFVRLLALAPEVRGRYDLSSLRFVLHAGGPCPASVKQQMIEWFGPVINEYYGSTEHGPLTFCTSNDWLAHRGTVGRPAPGVTLSIQDDTGQPMPPGSEGEILGRNQAHPDFTYHNRGPERDELQRGDLIMTGDIGYLDEDGYLYLRDRKRDVVISGGVNIYPAEIEGVLAEYPGVADSAVFAVPDAVFGESLMAIIQPEAMASLDTSAIMRFLDTRLASYKVPRIIEIRHELPREESGKIRKRLLRDPYWTSSPDGSRHEKTKSTSISQPVEGDVADFERKPSP